jgi:ABC-2 type transport system permease protein
VIVSIGAFSGLLRNPTLPLWAPLSIVFFIVFNLALSAGLRDLLGRLFARRRVRELLVLLFVVMAALPQLLLQTTNPSPDKIARILKVGSIGGFWPWTVFADVAVGRNTALAALGVLAWTAAAVWFGRSQFQRNLRFDAAAAQSSTDRRQEGVGFAEKLYRLPSLALPPQLGAMVEKELRFLIRAPRFRLVFIMSFTFGLMIWVPIFLRPGAKSGWHEHFLTAVMVYGVMLLSEVTVWNVFGFDRSAVQIYYAAPVTIRSVLVAKNIAAAVFIGIDALIVVTVCLVLPVHVSFDAIAEAVSLTGLVLVFILAIGNMISMRNPRPVDPSQSWRRTSAGRVQAFLLLIYLMMAIPIALAYGAQYAFDSRIAFYLVLALDFGIAAILYWLGLESAVETAVTRKEAIITTLSQGQGPVA